MGDTGMSGQYLRLHLVVRWWVLCLLPGAGLSAQSASVDAMTWVDSFLQVIRHDPDLSAGRKSTLADSAFQLSQEAGDICRQIHLRSVQAQALEDQGMADSALTILLWGIGQFRAGCDSIPLLACYNGLSYVYLGLGDFARVDSVCRLGLSMWNPGWTETNYRFAMLTNQAIARASQEDMEGAMTLFRQILKEARADDNTKYISSALNNLGTMQGILEDPDSAYYYFREAAELARLERDMGTYIPLLINMAGIDIRRERFRQAGILLDTAFQLAVDKQSLSLEADVQLNRAALYAAQGDYEAAYNYLDEYHVIREEYLNEERVRAVSEMMERYQAEQRESQIKQLEVDKLDATLRNERVTNARNRFMLVGLLIFLAAIGLWNRLRYVRRSKEAIQQQRDIADGLLLNILPAGVAGELKAKGHAEARHFASATILFSDFKSFTTVSEELTAAELVEEIDICFKAFDRIMDAFHIEKIKTIGDSYMAATGITEGPQASAADVVKAGLAMQAFVSWRKEARAAVGRPAFEMRVGIHSGPVVAGVVGVRKFQYDLWGDTVNTASRMESHGRVGKVNISESTYQLIRDYPELNCLPRGMVEAKGKGKLLMYFVQTDEPLPEIAALLETLQQVK